LHSVKIFDIIQDCIINLLTDGAFKRMNFLNKLTQPVMKPLPIKMGITFLIVTILCALLFISGTWGGLIMTGSGHESPGTSETPGSSPGTSENPNANENPGNNDSTGNNNPEENPHDSPGTTPNPEPSTFNPLSGLPMDEERTRNKPFAIVLSNEAAALPMNGVSQADIIYEYLVEGGITRMMAVFQDITNVQMIGSIRSARHYTVEIAESHGALFVHAGGSPQAMAEIRNRGITNFDEVHGTRRSIFFRNRSRINDRRLENLHSLVTTNTRIAEWLPRYDVRTEHNANFEQGFIFSDDAAPTGGSTAGEVIIRFSAAKLSTFTYNEADNVYHLRQFGRDFTDANNDAAVGFTNIIVMRTSVTGIPDDLAGRRNIVTVGSGEGYFINGGRYIEIKWSRADKESPFVYTHIDGTPLEFGRGATFIGIIPTSNVVDFR
jgi:hypothetical protein